MQGIGGSGQRAAGLNPRAARLAEAVFFQRGNVAVSAIAGGLLANFDHAEILSGNLSGGSVGTFRAFGRYSGSLGTFVGHCQGSGSGGMGCQSSGGGSHAGGGSGINSGTSSGGIRSTGACLRASVMLFTSRIDTLAQ